MLESAGAIDRDGTPATYKTLYMAMVGATQNAPLAATPAADAPPMDFLPFSARSAIASRHGMKVTAEFNALVREVIAEYRARAVPSDFAAAAPVVLPEPLAFYDGNKWYADEAAAICACADLPKLQKVYTEQQLRALLAGVSAPAAQAVAWRRSRREYHEYEGSAKEDTEGFAVIDYSSKQPPFGDGWEPLYAAPQAQADARGSAPTAGEQDARKFWAVIAPCGEGVLFDDERDARWTHTGTGLILKPTLGDEFRELYGDEELELVQLTIPAQAAQQTQGDE
ncbi:MAG: hypothetical protein RR707_00030 [Comamonas sp.]